jgi:hypothetical protein
MKVPKVLFVLHCPKLNPERKEFLTEHIKQRLPIEDIRWVENYNSDDPFVAWLHSYLKLPIGLNLTSYSAKYLEVFSIIKNENIESAFIADDDVLFNKDWLNDFENAPVLENIHYVNLSTSPFVTLQKSKINVTYNNGCTELVWCDNQFANEILDNLNLEEVMDIIHHGFLVSKGYQLVHLPIARQTSFISNMSSLKHEEKRMKRSWIEFVQNYKHLPKVSYIELLQKYEEYTLKKQKIEEAFKLEYGVVVNINRSEYILGEDKNIIQY